MDRYDRLKQDGICVKCGQQPAAPEGVCCQACGMKARAHTRKRQGFAGREHAGRKYVAPTASR